MAFPLATFEAAVPSRLLELDVADVLPPVEDGGRVADLSGRVAELENRITRLQEAMIEGQENEAGLPVLRELDRRRREVAAELALAQQEVASPAHEQRGTLKGLASAVETDAETRLRVRAAPGRLIERVDCLVIPGWNRRLAAVQVRFANRPVSRSYLILHHHARRGPKGGKVPSRWEARSFAAEGEFDLQNAEHVAQLERALLAADPG